MWGRRKSKETQAGRHLSPPKLALKRNEEAKPLGNNRPAPEGGGGHSLRSDYSIPRLQERGASGLLLRLSALPLPPSWP